MVVLKKELLKRILDISVDILITYTKRHYYKIIINKITSGNFFPTFIKF